MTVEFYHCNTGAFKESDYVIIDGKWFTYNNVDENAIETILRNLLNINNISNYARTLLKRGINNHKELVRCIAMHFFPMLNKVNDINEDGTVNIEKNN